MPIGIVATTAHQNGNAKSAMRPTTVNVIQKTFRCIGLLYQRIRAAYEQTLIVETKTEDELRRA